MTKYFQEYGYDPYIICSDQEGELSIGIEENHIFRIGGAEKDLSQKMSLFRKMIGKSIDFLPFYLRTLNKESLYWYWLVKDSIRRIEKRLPRPDVIIGSCGPISDIYISRYLSARWKIPWIADLRDYVSDWDGREKKIHFKSIDIALEKWLLKTVTGMTVISKGIRDICHKRYQSLDICLAYNGWDEETADAKSYTESQIPYKMYLYYAGNIYDHQYKCVELLVKTYSDAVNNNLTPLPLVIRKAQNNETWKKSEELVKKNKLEEYIHFLPSATATVCKIEALQSSGNLVFGELDSVENSRLIDIPAKTFELMSMKRAIILIDRIDSELAGLIKDTDSGLVIDSSETLMKLLLEGGGDEYTWKNTDSYSRKNQCEIICWFIDKMFETRANRYEK